MGFRVRFWHLSDIEAAWFSAGSESFSDINPSTVWVAE
jgi:hypothetical protein